MWLFLLAAILKSSGQLISKPLYSNYILKSLSIPVAWLAAPLFGPVTAVTTMFLASGLSVVMQTITIPSGSGTFTIGGPILNSGTVGTWEIVIDNNYSINFNNHSITKLMYGAKIPIIILYQQWLILECRADLSCTHTLWVGYRYFNWQYFYPSASLTIIINDCYAGLIVHAHIDVVIWYTSDSHGKLLVCFIKQIINDRYWSTNSLAIRRWFKCYHKCSSCVVTVSCKKVYVATTYNNGS